MMKRIFAFSIFALIMLSFISTALAQTNPGALEQACILKYGGDWDNLDEAQQKECDPSAANRPNLVANEETIKLQPIIIAQSNLEGKMISATCTPKVVCTQWSGCLGMKALNFKKLVNGGKMDGPLESRRGCKIEESCGMSNVRIMENVAVKKDCINFGGRVSFGASEKGAALNFAGSNRRKSILKINLPGLKKPLNLNGLGKIDLALIAMNDRGGIELGVDNAAAEPAYNIKLSYKF